MASKNYLIFDFGASNGRAIVATVDGGKFSMKVTHRFDNRPVSAAGTLYWDILRLFSELKIGIQKSYKAYPDLSSMAIDTWGCDFGIIDKHGKLLASPVHYRDQKRHARAAQLYEILPEKELFTLSAGNTIPIMGIYQLFSSKQDQATEFLHAGKFLMIPDLLNYFLTGTICNEYCDATMSLLCNQNEKTWEKKILERLDIPREIFSELVMPGTKIGSIQDSICREIEIQPIPVIVPATHDTASAVAGIPLVDKDKHWAFISMGTWCISGVETMSPIVTDQTFTSGYGNAGCPEGRTMLVKYMTGLWIVQQCRERWIKDQGKDLSWDDIVKVSSSMKSTSSFIDIDNPRFGQPQIDMPKVIADYCTETGQTVPQSMGEVARCVYESLVMKFRHNLETLEQLTGKKIELLHLVGGGTQNKLLCQWTADAIGVPVIAGPTETTSVGNLLMQLKGTGEIEHIEEGRQISLNSSEVTHHQSENKEIWDEPYRKYLTLFS